jgi:outer membrane protein assembly factor BamB
MKNNHLLIFSGLLFATLLASPHAAASNWPSWRGPNGNGTSPEKNLPAKWSTTENVAWKIDLPGAAGATPAIWENKIFVTSASENDLVLLCISTDGKVLWKKPLAGGNKKIRNDEGNSAAPSPATDGKHVWTFLGTGDMHCFDMTGKMIWEKNFQKSYGAFDHWHGMSSTPLLVGDTLYQMCLQMENPYIVALDKLTGKERWKVARESDALHESRHSYASPILYQDGAERQLLIHGADYLSAHKLEDGKELWRCGSLNPKKGYNKFLRFVASPACEPGLVVIPSAKNKPVLGVKPDGKGDISESKSHLRWRRGRDTSDVPTPVIHDGLLYLARENGVMIVMDAMSGKEVYLQRVHRNRQRASPVIADGKLYLAARHGEVCVLKLGREFKVISRNVMKDGIAATPAISGGRIYLRTYKSLYAIGK